LPIRQPELKYRHKTVAITLCVVYQSNHYREIGTLGCHT
jgi:hypothetical protein